MIGMILTGFIVGLLARFLMPGRDPMGFLLTTGLGIAGAALAAVLGRAVGWYRPGEPAGFIAAIGGALLLLAAYHFAFNRRTVASPRV
jgi:uncharacterized membrane protein YeaQ/YmgE (transglycosylase-associated protein family)